MRRLSLLSLMSLQINLLPEYGWSIREQPVYGPGSVFQGFVKLNITTIQAKLAGRLRLVFHATESTYNTSYLQPTYSNQLFGSQKILWHRKETRSTDNILIAGSDIIIPFIIQMPMIQFPPSVDIVSKELGLSYHSNFSLTAYLDQIVSSENILKARKPITFMPFIETAIYKKPMMITTYDNAATSDADSLQETKSSISVNIPSLDYLPGEHICLSLTFQNIPKKSVESLTVKLMKVQTWKKITPSKKGKGCKYEKKSKQQVIHKNVPFTTSKSESSNGFINCPFKMTVDIPTEITPTFAYGLVFSLSYYLELSVKRKGKFMTHNYDLMDIPITIGTLGYGIKPSEEIKVYSIFKSVFDDDNNVVQNHQPSSSGDSVSLSATILPVPKFIDALEYEDSLPVYVEDRLPAYDTIVQNSPPNCII